ncbi:MAG TPA: trehalose-6-phosphate synthase, partial [Anaeromyxobacteraceae bacterium]
MIVVLGLLAWGAASLLSATARSWFERDVAMRARLAAGSARDALLAHATAPDRRRLAVALDSIARDERIMAAAACSATGGLLARTGSYPDRFGCAEVLEKLPHEEAGTHTGGDFSDVLEGGTVLVSALPVEDDGIFAGTIILVHDMSYVARREAAMRRYTVAAFAVVALLASVLTVALRRMSWRSWTQELRRLLVSRRGEMPGRASREQFQPVLADVRQLVSELAAQEAGVNGGRWSAERLRQVIDRTLHGEGVVVVANREPYVHDRLSDGTIEVRHPASGLVTALKPVMHACSGTWVAHGSGRADRETVDRHDRLLVPPGEHAYTLRRVWLSAEEERGYYYGFSNEGLWPLCHVAHTRPSFRAEDWRDYQRVNERFADAVCDEVVTKDPTVLVQDYHFALVPRFLRERLPRANVITFWHIPWPNAEQFGICPWAGEVLSGLLGSSIMGFQTQLHCNNFLESVDRFLEARIDREKQSVVHGGRECLVRSYPISIDHPNRWAAEAPPANECRRSVREELGLGPDALLGVGVDRLDYTKGIEERLLAVERLLERWPHLRGRFTFVQLAAPSRTLIERYRALDASVAALTERINARFAAGDYRPVVLRCSHHEPPTVFRYMRAADVCYVSSLHD